MVEAICDFTDSVVMVSKANANICPELRKAPGIELEMSPVRVEGDFRTV